MKIFIVNLADSQDRRQVMERQIAEINGSGFVGEFLSSAILESATSATDKKPTGAFKVSREIRSVIYKVRKIVYLATYNMER